ncbi:MAG: type IV pilus assembly protein PilM [Planctomycetota bacterium]
MFQFRKKNQSILGLDIGSREIKAVELTRTGGGFAVTRLAAKPLVSEQAAVETLRQLAQESKFKTMRTISSVSGRSVVVRYITMQPMTAAELRTAMKYEAEKYIPFGMDEVVIDSQCLEGAPEKGRRGAEMKVLLVAAKRDLIVQHINTLSQAGFQPAVVDVDAFALGNSYRFVRASALDTAPPAGEGGASKVVGIVDIGASKTNINIARGRISMFTREIYVGGNDFTNSISRYKGLNFNEAEGMKLNPSTPKEELEGAVGLTIEDLGNEIQLSFDYFENQFEAEVSEVLLTGGGSLLRGLAEAFEVKFRKSTKVWNPLAEVPVQAGSFDAEVIQDVGPRTAIALGLASRMNI